MNRILSVIVFAAATIPAAAWADQCAWVDKEQAREAVHFAAKGLKFVDYCEPCGDTLEKLSVKTIESVKSGNADDGVSQEVAINGEAKDLAYVFVETVKGSNEFENLANLANCKTTDVSPKITVTPKKTAPPKKSVKPGVRR